MESYNENENWNIKIEKNKMINKLVIDEFMSLNLKYFNKVQNFPYFKDGGMVEKNGKNGVKRYCSVSYEIDKNENKNDFYVSIGGSIQIQVENQRNSPFDYPDGMKQRTKTDGRISIEFCRKYELKNFFFEKKKFLKQFVCYEFLGNGDDKYLEMNFFPNGNKYITDMNLLNPIIDPVDKNLFDIFIKDISILNKLGFIPIIVHGGGIRISNKLNELGIKSNFIKGLRVTEEKTIRVVEQVLIEFNTEIIKALKRQACNSKTINSKENNIITVVQENEKLGFVGIPTKINKSIIDRIVNEKKVPVIAPLGLDINNQTYNINADTAAGSIAKKIEARRLIIMSDVEGVLDENKKLISEINSNSIKDLVDNEVVTGGMIPKINNCLDVANNGVKGVVIIDGRKNHSILFELLSDKGSGTLIRQ